MLHREEDEGREQKNDSKKIFHHLDCLFSLCADEQLAVLPKTVEDSLKSDVAVLSLEMRAIRATNEEES